MEINLNKSKFRYEHTYILYLVYEGFKKGALNSEEKSELKELIFSNHPIIEQIFSFYEKEGKVESFWSKLKEVCNN